MPPASCTVPEDFRATVVRILAYMGGLAILAIVAASFFQGPARVVLVKPAPPPEWVNVERPHPAFELVMPDLARAGSDYAILRRSADGARRDVISYGGMATPGPFMQVEIDRPGSAGERFIDAPSEIAARITAYSVTDDVKPAGSLDSKFGAMPLVDFAMAVRPAPDRNGAAAAAAPRRCLGFAKAFDAPVLQIAGWYCSPGEQVVDRATVACALDRLTLLSAGGDATLAGLFARAEIRRTFCGQRSPILAATPERDRPVPIPRVVHGLPLRRHLSER